MLKNNLGFPRIGSHRQLKKACESYWSGKISLSELLEVGKKIRVENWKLQQELGIDLIPSNDFSFYDHVLDHSLMFGVIPQRFEVLKHLPEVDQYFAMARGYQQNGFDLKAMEMTKWFDTNYHYIVPEFTRFQTFKLNADKIISEFREAKNVGIIAKPVIIGPVSYLLLGKEKEEGFDKLSLLDRLLPVYCDLIARLVREGAEWIQFDEPFLALDISYQTKDALRVVYQTIRKEFPALKILVATYFDGLQDNFLAALNLPICALHIDLVRCPEQLDEILPKIPKDFTLSLGLIDGRNIWKTDYQKVIPIVEKVIKTLGSHRVMLAPSCSLIHSPCNLENETKISAEIQDWLAFAQQKLIEIAEIYEVVVHKKAEYVTKNEASIQRRQTSPLIHKLHVKNRVNAVKPTDLERKSPFLERQSLQKSVLNLPLFPTTTIGSFPQTDEIRAIRAKFKKGEISVAQYDEFIKLHTQKVVAWQEELGFDVLVHGEFERNDMVEYFGELLSGFVFSENGWVQSYGSRCVKPPIIFGDIERKTAMTVEWSSYAQSLTQKPMKGMLTGPITILQWSFVRDDQPRSTTMMQIAWAIRDEVVDLEKADIKIIQIDEAALREGLPLRQAKRAEYLKNAIDAFKISASGVQDQTQIHTHMCYSEFNDIIENIAEMDADVITIETSRSQMELLEAFAKFNYPNEIGPGVYDIHSPRVPSVEEMEVLLLKAIEVLPAENLWVNPDCGLKTRKWPETEQALINMIEAAHRVRERVTEFA
ncbi:MAG: 5-methyltetrahydropteroyltriglutamate--homocysteine S-methyltransferase [Emticicia sp.]|uniref:5-methyltetrahydropteroyltriglutamate-- homocysteine S-methyltransferase n=1 Tax=Emticicia sp. TaxID=1930953 RepID=UPI003BA7239D